MLYTIVDTEWLMRQEPQSDLQGMLQAKWVSLPYGKLEISDGKVVSVRSTDPKDYLNKSYYPGTKYAK